MKKTKLKETVLPFQCLMFEPQDSHSGHLPKNVLSSYFPVVLADSLIIHGVFIFLFGVFIFLFAIFRLVPVRQINDLFNFFKETQTLLDRKSIFQGSSGFRVLAFMFYCTRSQNNKCFCTSSLFPFSLRNRFCLLTLFIISNYYCHFK